ncbi:peptide chain release factor H [Cohaesibacter gelatinilyticus]|uniref:Peptide chain release factor n=1 Tax=Cohaesibacter gelatinilyticus TaxID=372072 RepID=A0A285PLT0_9HYPH|nr:peptide chain release factor H [Cohaesibacter gelatinilyticus]SNZ21076.1 peptide chain release factor [Cohaesibacter gelatinilyticus]
MIQQSTRLLVTSGDGPSECQRAVSLCLQKMQKAAHAAGLGIQIDTINKPDKGCVPSALVTLSGGEVTAFLAQWCGTIQWICKSPFRPNHKRQNWYIGVFPLAQEEETTKIRAEDLQYETFRAGGPGGQHQNTTDSAVRLTHIPSGISVISRDERSQHRNKHQALERMKAKFILQESQKKAISRHDQNNLHKQLERGNPVRTFRGKDFR